MTLFTYISQNLERVKFDVRIGLITCGTLKHFQIYSRYDYYKRLGNSTCDAFVGVCNDFQVEQRWVYKIIKKMEASV